MPDQYVKVRPDFDVIRQIGISSLAAHWCTWRTRDRGDGKKPAKAPHHRGAMLRVSDPEAWPDFETVAADCSENDGGIGLLMAGAPGLVALDLDGCLGDDGQVLPEKSEMVADFVAVGGYCEISPSGRGLRQFVRGVKPEVFREFSPGGLEVYDSDSARYVSVTGRPYPAGSEPRPIAACQTELERFLNRWAARDEAEAEDEGDALPAGEAGPSRTAAEVIRLLTRGRSGPKWRRLLDGDLADYEGDHSAADLALCIGVAYFERDAKVIDSVLRGSKLFRPKWDERRGRGKTYGSETIAEALRRQTDSYDRRKADRAAKTEARATKADALAEAGAVLVGGLDDLREGDRLRRDAWALSELLIRDRRLLGTVFFDEFAMQTKILRSLRDVLGDPSAPQGVGPLTDGHVSAFSRWFGRCWGLTLRRDDVAEAVEALAGRVSLNPVADRLRELAEAWDGRARLDEWLVRYCRAATEAPDGGDISSYVEAVGRRWLISVCARGFQPGSKSDCMLLLEGPQGARKSSAVRALAEAIDPEIFREGFSLGDGADKDTRLALRGKLIVEWGEIAGLSRHDQNSLKNFLTLREDAYRAPYGRLEMVFPRTAVFVGTTNDAGYLSDPTGGRRFWPVRVGRIDLEALQRDAPQIIGEAARAYLDGSRWWFDDSDPRDVALLELASGEQRARQGGGLWAEFGADLAEALVGGGLEVLEGGPADATCRFSVVQMRTWLRALSGADVTDQIWLRAAAGLRLAGWTSTKSHGRSVWFLDAGTRGRYRSEAA